MVISDFIKAPFHYNIVHLSTGGFNLGVNVTTGTSRNLDYCNLFSESYVVSKMADRVDIGQEETKCPRGKGRGGMAEARGRGRGFPEDGE